MQMGSESPKDDDSCLLLLMGNDFRLELPRANALINTPLTIPSDKLVDGMAV